MANVFRLFLIGMALVYCAYSCPAQMATPSSDWSNVMSLPPGSELIVMTRRPLHCDLAYVDAASVVCARSLQTRFDPTDTSFAVARNDIDSVTLQRPPRQASRRNDDVKAGASGGLAVGLLVGLLTLHHTSNGFVPSVMAGTAAGAAVGWIVQHKHTPKPMLVYVAPVNPVAQPNTITSAAMSLTGDKP